jgi:DNA-binding response OmpR family regulator
MGTGDRPSVLVVDDDEDVLETYRLWLSDDYDLETATSGATALEAIDEDTDIVLVDRLVPGTSGREIVERIRETGHDCQVAMATAVEPDFDVLEMDFDAYLTKALDRETVLDTIETLYHRATYDDRLQKYFSLAEKRALLTARKSGSELAANENFGELESRLDALEDELDSLVAEMNDEDFLAAIQHIESDIEES